MAMTMLAVFIAIFSTTNDMDTFAHKLHYKKGHLKLPPQVVHTLPTIIFYEFRNVDQCHINIFTTRRKLLNARH